MKQLEELLKESAAMHDHLCPRQVIGVRMGLMAGTFFQLDLPQTSKRLLTIAETDGCTVDGISVSTGCTVGHRTLRIEDYGKVAATFVDTQTNSAIRLVPRSTLRYRAYDYAPPECSKWEAYLLGYQRMPDDEMFLIQHVELKTPLHRILSKPGLKAFCSQCREEMMNGREISKGGKPLCKACLGEAYYRFKVSEPFMEVETCPLQ